MNALRKPDPKRVLVVDDDPSILAMTEDLLTDAGYEVGRSSSGKEALERIGEREVAWTAPDGLQFILTFRAVVKCAGIRMSP